MAKERKPESTNIEKHIPYTQKLAAIQDILQAIQNHHIIDASELPSRAEKRGCSIAALFAQTLEASKTDITLQGGKYLSRVLFHIEKYLTQSIDSRGTGSMRSSLQKRILQVLAAYPHTTWIEKSTFAVAFSHDLTNSLNIFALLKEYEEVDDTIQIDFKQDFQSYLGTQGSFHDFLEKKQQELELKQKYTLLEKKNRDTSIISVDVAIQMIQEHCDANSYTIAQTDIPSHISGTIGCNKAWFHILLQELITNSKKHGNDGILTWEVDGNNLVVTMKDNVRPDDKIHGGEGSAIIDYILTEKLKGPAIYTDRTSIPGMYIKKVYIPLQTTR